MSTVVVLNLPEHGHMNATFPVVAELVRRGEYVIYYATEDFRAKVEATGAEFADYGDPAAFRPPAHTGGLYSVMAFLIGLAERVLPDLIERFQREPPDYLLLDSMCVWGNLLRQVLNIPAASFATVVVPNDALVSTEEMVERAYGQAPKELILDGIDALNTYIEISRRIDKRFGTLSPNIVEFFANRQDLNIVFTSRYFHLMGEHFDKSYRFVGPSIETRSEQIEFPADQLGSEPLIYIAMGTIFNDLPGFYRACFEAFGGTRYRVVMSVGRKTDRAALGVPPENFIVREYVPQLELLPRVSLFVTHGGSNSVNEALWFGVPLIVFPQHGEQHIVAGQIVSLKAGLRLTPPDLEPSRLRGLAETVLSQSSFKEQSLKISESFKEAGGYQRAAAEILQFRDKVVR